jgi:hypothetical protein
MLRPRRFWSIYMLSFLECTAGTASAQAPANPTFEVASIKPNKSGSNQRQVNWEPNGRFTAINVPLDNLIRFAYAEPGPDGFSVHFHQIDCRSLKHGSGARLLWSPISSMSSQRLMLVRLRSRYF